MTLALTFDEFKKEWLLEIEELKTTVEKGRRFCLKLIAHRFDLDEADELPEGVFYCDGSKDGGIDLAYLDAHDPDDPDGGDTWYLAQSKYGTALQGVGTIITEGQKVIDTLDGRRETLSSVAADVLARVTEFRNGASPRDRLVLLFVTTEELKKGEKKALDDVRVLGRERLGRERCGPLFDVEHISLRSIYDAEPEAKPDVPLTIPLRAQLVPSGDDLLVGTVALNDLYEFLEAYRVVTKELDRIFERNVRRFLGNRGKVNQAIEKTLLNEPEQFGLFNNGITFVVSQFTFDAQGGQVQLTNPHIVNGCQTTRTLWNVFDRKLNSGGTGDPNPKTDAWKSLTAQGVVVTKVVRVPGGDENKLQQNIIRFTNSQNAVTEKDFLALTDGLSELQQQMEQRFGVYLEIEKGGWDAMRARMKSRQFGRQFSKQHANLFELMKVYGAGWLSVPGVAVGQNKAFLPGGRIYHKIRCEGRDLDADDLYAAYRLKQEADERKFGRGAKKDSHKLTRFLFYFTVCELLRAVLGQLKRSAAPSDLTPAMLRLFKDDVGEPLFATAESLIDNYMREPSDSYASVFNEPRMEDRNDLNAFLKWDRVGQDSSKPDEICPCPKYREQIRLNATAFGLQFLGRPSVADPILKALANS